MPRRGSGSRRSIRELLLRIAISIAIVVVGGFALTFSAAQIIVRSNPATAYRLAPYDGRVQALLAASLSGPDANMSERRQSDILAHDAIRHDPALVLAVSTLGVNAMVRGDTSGARKLFIYSKHLSRRNRQTQLWAIEDAASRGNIPDVLQNYDVALRTSPELAPLLYPILTGAIGDGNVRSNLVRTLAKKPIWSSEFIDFAATKGKDLRSAVMLFEALHQAGIKLANAASSNMIGNLVAGGLYNQAWNYYATLHPGVDRRRSRDSHFTVSGDAPSLFDWMPSSEGGVSASIQRGNRGGVFVFSAPSSTGGASLRQMQMLPPGEYQLTGHSEGVRGATDANPYWVLKCADNRELGRVVVPASVQSSGSFSGQFAVLQGCPIQTLELIARPSDEVGGSSGQIDWVQLVRREEHL